MKRPRPFIPLSVRLRVAHRQLARRAGWWSSFHDVQIMGRQFPRADDRLRAMLQMLFGQEKVHLDHDPPLRARPYNPRIKSVAARYTPNANDPAHLIYRTAEEHRLKTNVRGDGAQHPDRVLIKRERRREKPRRKARTNWPSGRKIPSRPFQKRAK